MKGSGNMIYSDVINNKWNEILPKKNKYNVNDVKKVMANGFNKKESKFIVICTAIYHNTSASYNVYKNDELEGYIS